MPGEAAQLIGTTINEVIRTSGPVKLSFGVVASLWSASMGMGAIMNTLNAAYDLRESRSVFSQYATAVVLTVVITLLMTICLVAAVFGDDAVAALSSGPSGLLVWKIAKWPIGLALLAGALEITYYFAPDLSDRDWKWFTPGAIAGLIGLALVAGGLRLYFKFSTSYGYAYGSLADVVVLLLWFYLSGIALLAGGVLNAALEMRTDGQVS